MQERYKDEYMQFLKQVYFFERAEREKENLRYNANCPTTSSCIKKQIQFYEEGQDAKRTINTWKRVKNYYSSPQDYEMKIGNFYQSNPIYISMLYLMNRKVLELLPIYEDIILEKKYNPNNNHYLYEENLFFEHLPNPITLGEPRFIELNKEVLKNYQTDFHQIGNGEGMIKRYLNAILNINPYPTVSTAEKKYYLEMIKSALSGSLSVIDSNRYSYGHEVKKDAYIKWILTNQPEDIQEEWEELKRILLSLEGIRHQFDVSHHSSMIDKDTIHTYLSHLPKDESFREKETLLKMLRR